MHLYQMWPDKLEIYFFIYFSVFIESRLMGLSLFSSLSLPRLLSGANHEEEEGPQLPGFQKGGSFRPEGALWRGVQQRAEAHNGLVQ